MKNISKNAYEVFFIAGIKYYSKDYSLAIYVDVKNYDIIGCDNIDSIKHV